MALNQSNVYITYDVDFMNFIDIEKPLFTTKKEYQGDLLAPKRYAAIIVISSQNDLATQPFSCEEMFSIKYEKWQGKFTHIEGLRQVNLSKRKIKDSWQFWRKLSEPEKNAFTSAIQELREAEYKKVMINTNKNTRSTTL